VAGSRRQAALLGQPPQPVRFNRKLVRFMKADVVAWIEGGA
jgi:hypothetical protein